VVVSPVHVSIKYILYYVLLGTARPRQFGLERLDGVLVLEAKSLLDMPLKDDDGVCVLLSLAERTLVRSFKPGEYALGMKHVLTGEAFL
jgi:hypothetical protein